MSITFSSQDINLTTFSHIDAMVITIHIDRWDVSRILIDNEYITFDVVDMAYPYNAIFGRGLLNTFEAALHSAYLCLKVPATFGVITVFNSQREARNIEKGFTLGHKNVQFLWEQQGKHEAQPPIECRNFIEVEGEFKKVPLDPRVLDKSMHQHRS
jgi:hypothetical protein